MRDDTERLVRHCMRDVKLTEDDIAREDHRRRKAEEREERAREREAARAERRAGRVASLARELDDRYGDAGDDVIIAVRRDYEHQVEAARRDWVEMREFVILVPIGAALLVPLMVALPFRGLAWVDGLILLVLALLVAYVLFEWHEVTRAALLADALDRVLAMRAARRGKAD